MPEVLGPDDFGQLTLICNSHKCLNLNSIMPKVLGSDDLGQLTLICNSYKCLNLNSATPKVLRLNDMNKLTPHCYDYKRLNDFYVAIKYLGPLVSFELTYSTTLDQIKAKCSMTCLNSNFYQYLVKVICLFVRRDS